MDEVALPDGSMWRTLRVRANCAGVALCILVLGIAGAGLGGCDGPQSALDPAGYDAKRLAELFWVMCAGALAIWAGVMAIAIYAARRRDAPEGAANLLILGGGVVFSVAILTALLVYGLMLMGTLRAYSGAG